MEHDVPIVVGYARRAGHGFQYEMGVSRIIYPDEWKTRDNPLVWITEAYSKAMEKFIHEAPEQYLWIHRRWKSRPKGEGSGK
jgi:KDO2-lipid IV(A) lauroyltransferase